MYINSLNDYYNISVIFLIIGAMIYIAFSLAITCSFALFYLLTHLLITNNIYVINYSFVTINPATSHWFFQHFSKFYVVKVLH